MPTTYYLTVADAHICTHSELERVDLVILNDVNAVFSGNPLKGLVDGGAIFMQSPLRESGRRVAPPAGRTTAGRFARRTIRVYFADTVRIAREVASEPTCRCGCRASSRWAHS